MGFSAKVLRDSVSPDGVRLTTMEVTFPRIILAEFNTHRVFSRNSASSRAIPVEKMLQKVKDDPFIPVYWGKNQKGMQAEQELTEEEQELAKFEWLVARKNAVVQAERLLAIGVHKQITNRLLEPWLWHTVIVTSTEWDNFWGLRDHKAAQPEMGHIAKLMREAYDTSTPSPVNYGDWHLPLIQPGEEFDLLVGETTIDDVCKISAGRCARVSYLTHDGKRDPKADIEMCERLIQNGHMSPLEHVARPMTVTEIVNPNLNLKVGSNFRGWVQLRKTIPNENNFLARQNV
jgi:thymidylate synthase ThyX